MFETLPAGADEFSTWPWPRLAPYYDELLARPLTTQTVVTWLTDWTRLAAVMEDTIAKLEPVAQG